MGTMMKKITYLVAGILLLVLCGSVLSGAVEFHSLITSNIQRFNSFPEYGGLMVLGSVLIFGATILRRKRTARSR
jgi:hypothetical protein